MIDDYICFVWRLIAFLLIDKYKILIIFYVNLFVKHIYENELVWEGQQI